MTGTLSESARDRQKMIEENLGLVHSCAHRFKGRGIEYDDLFQAGCMGLVKACDAFDFSLGVRFSTYAVPVILGEMRRLFRDGGTVKVSRSLKELSLRVVRGREQLARSGWAVIPPSRSWQRNWGSPGKRWWRRSMYRRRRSR